jgi:hypothetical protein
MKNLILLSLVCSGFVAAIPFKASAIETPQVTNISNNSIDIAQYRRNDRQFNVYYRNRGSRQWILENSYFNRREAERASRRLERRGYNTYVQLSREVNRRYG